MKKLYVIFILSLGALMIVSCSENNGSGNVEGARQWTPDLTENQAEIKASTQKNFYIIFDGSGSMYGNKIIVARKALKRFISMIPEDANVGLLAFDASGNFERGKLGSDRGELVRQVDSFQAGGSTPLGASVEIAHRELKKQYDKQLGYGEYNIVIVTDGQATDRHLLRRAVRKVLGESPIVIHTIGFHIGTGHTLNQPGKIYYKTAQNFEELSEGLEEVLAETENFVITEFK
jgi:Ca-activated chloride channel family protein